jgi:hypothetical protein
MIKTYLTVSAILVASMLNAGTTDELKNRNKTEVTSTLLTPAPDDEGIKGNKIVTATAGFNLLSTSLSLKYLFRDFLSVESATASPIFNLNFDYGLARNFSLGVGGGYQTAQVQLNDYDEFSGDYYDYTDNWKRFYLAVKGDYHIVAKQNVSLYTGLRVGYNFYSVNSGTRAIEKPSAATLNLASPIVHAHFGFSYFIKGIVGFNAEVGLGYGGPYIPAIGVTAKF